jgi:hypothetical protein
VAFIAMWIRVVCSERGKNIPFICVICSCKCDVSLSHSFPCTDITISYKNQPMHSNVINTTLLALCYSDMFRPSKGHLQGARLIHCHSQINNICTRCIILNFISGTYFVRKLNFTFVTFSVDLAVKMLPVDGPFRVETCQSSTVLIKLC